MRLLTWLTATPLDEVTPATRGWLAAERDARIAELEAQLAASEDEKRRFQRMYGKASAEIGRGRAELARERQARLLQQTFFRPKLDEATVQRLMETARSIGAKPYVWGGRVGTAASVPNTADADAALVATAEHLGNEVGPDRTAAIEGAAITLRAHQRLVASFDACACGWSERGVTHVRHVAEQLAAVGALGGRAASYRPLDPEAVAVVLAETNTGKPWEDVGPGTRLAYGHMAREVERRCGPLLTGKAVTS